MRSGLLKDTDKRFRTRTFGIIAVMLIFTAIIVSLILIFSTLNTLLMMSTDTLNKLNDVSTELDEVRQSIDTMQENRSTGQIEARTGTFTVTHYCLENYPHICNDGDSTQTASGETPIPYYTIAADKSIPFGTMMEIDGKQYEVMDRGGNITENRIDIAVPTHSEALSRGKFERTVQYEISMP